MTKTAGVDPVGSRASTEHGHTIGVSYQPIVELPDARIAVVEALVRGVDPGVELDEGMFDSPELLGRVVDHVIASAKNLGDLTVSVNLSGHDLSSTATLEHTGRLVDHLGVKRVQLEVSELSAPFGPTALRLLDHLRLIGVAVVLDHFGAGMTATAVRSHQFDGVKLDRALQSDRRPSALGVAEALVAFANNLGLEVTAVGVEDAAVLVALTDAGVARFQGHMFAKAMPAELIARQLS
ncbi:MAG: EAL domain-containing protein [Acidobacteria bacterium]|nr:EAL domain-containing protein [Acidobacteriota bacterium]